MEFFVYILYSVSRDKYYIGHTEDVSRRIQEHRIRKNLGADDWELLYKESFPTRSEAMKREREIKQKKKRSYILQLITSQQ